ncbi:hypothetical protein BV25DRAFT_1914826 [Artomyces pyxidatus]|uniref:Uncharacterized protein n=1 Tax=Artomyces pyxidatus TaxID=48021 RepID=A0ACB8T5N4_9AGAM|nr:hypothetical protein BV25DRAFT_1914826 [Artomyces pyxidatus]
MAHYSKSTSSWTSAAPSRPHAPPPTPVTRIGIVFHDYIVYRGKIAPLWSLFLTATQNFHEADDAFVYTVSDLFTPGANTLSFRGGTVPDPAMIKDFIGILHIADVRMTPQALIASLRSPEHWGNPIDNSKWVLLTLLNWQQQSIIPPLRWGTQKELLRGITESVERLRGMWGQPGATGFPIISISN